MISYLSVIHFDALSQAENNLFKKIKIKKPLFIMVCMKSKEAQVLCLVPFIFTTIFLTLIFIFVEGTWFCFLHT